MRRTLMQIAREGWPILVLASIVTFGVGHFGHWLAALPLVVVVLLLLAFFHDPRRRIPSEPLAVIAPVDGRVVHRRECYDPFLDREAIRVSLDASLLGAYLLRSPVEGTVLELPAAGESEFAGTVSWLRTDEGDDIVLAASGWMFGGRPCQVRYGDRLGQGRVCGARRLARRVYIFLPAHSRVEVAVGDRVRAGSDKLATLVRKAPVDLPSMS
ncbi:hypothetical protein [Spectribacter hydrogenoxidans]|uniref:Phosphatidylserine decarboxylase n=1 Tax=Spectribacter hydrogenoxidans TaxID=3075608 RepID=A0ABU3BXX1_9GAMM|nr:hypothetical protein [Salinisphaera sp. W335]MDT0634148.1 hypothetical protein [Salinisphaera sp. W335]